MAAAHGSGSKPRCLIVLPSAVEGVSAQSFIQSYTLTHSAFHVQLATPGGRNPEYVDRDDQSRKWLNDFHTKPHAVPLALDVIDPNRYSCLLLPHAPGAGVDLYNDYDLGQIISQFYKDRKIICAIGMGVLGLLAARNDDDKTWCFETYSLTGSSVFELASWPNFSDILVVPEDGIRQFGATYSSSEAEAVHVVIDRHVVTGQNEFSTLTAVQNLVLLCNQWVARVPAF